jgi:hypothetical protein
MIHVSASPRSYFEISIRNRSTRPIGIRNCGAWFASDHSTGLILDGGICDACGVRPMVQHLDYENAKPRRKSTVGFWILWLCIAATSSLVWDALSHHIAGASRTDSGVLVLCAMSNFLVGVILYLLPASPRGGWTRSPLTALIAGAVGAAPIALLAWIR